ncbi:MAG: hypothetical protein QGI45_08610 [Myxococcota bacterium]|jgi:hypothetical protein|nr:hypothetical protein [Myxococcota bacterium]
MEIALVKKTLGTTISAFALLICLGIPQNAWACPACAGNNDGGNLYLIILGSMILLPFGVTYIVYRLLKQSKVHEERIMAQFANVSEGRTP